ncbi:MAG: hypothetical protein R3C19_06805 [Planctomycetaceae bacterium]
MNESAAIPVNLYPRSKRVAVLRRLSFVAAMLSLVAFGLVFPFPLHSRRWGAIFDLAHAPAFCILMLMITGVLDPPAIGLSRRFLTILKMSMAGVALLAVVLAGIGLTGEFLQKFANRNPSWHDVAANTLGLAAAVCWIAAQHRRGVLRASLIAAAFALLIGVSVDPLLEIHELELLRRDMPLLASFERPRELHGWYLRSADMLRTSDWATDGTHSLRVTLRPGRYPGAAFISPEPNWRGYETLKLDLRNPGQQPLPLIVKVHDQEHEDSNFDHSDRFHREIVVPAGEDLTVSIALSDIESAPAARTMNMENVSFIEVFSLGVEDEQVFFIDNLRLQ